MAEPMELEPVTLVTRKGVCSGAAGLRGSADPNVGVVKAIFMTHPIHDKS